MALACNGLSMLMTLAATMTATIILIPLPTWKRIVLLISVVPIALLTNMARIVTTGGAITYRRTKCQGVGPRRVWLDDDAAGNGTGWAGIGDLGMARARR